MHPNAIANDGAGGRATGPRQVTNLPAEGRDRNGWSHARTHTHTHTRARARARARARELAEVPEQGPITQLLQQSCARPGATTFP